jgi:phage terminase large subunit-like protein
VLNLPNSYQALVERLLNERDLQMLQELVEVWDGLTSPQQIQQANLWKDRLYWDNHTSIATWFNDPEVRAAYPKQIQHCKYGATYDERALLGGNRTGKTHCGTYEDTLHLTGLYPDWWEGRRFEYPIGAWVATDTAKNGRDILQEKFCGEPGVPQLFGTGMIPIDLFASDPTSKHGIANAYESVFVHHHTNGIYDGVSTLMFKSYDQGRQAFQGTQQDLIHLDEEPKIEVYTECSLRLMSTSPGDKNGALVLTETPLLGISELMISFMPELNPLPDTTPLREYDHDQQDYDMVIDEQ